MLIKKFYLFTSKPPFDIMNVKVSKGGLIMKNKLKYLVSACLVLMFVVFSTINTFAYNNSAITTGDSTTIVVVVLSIILVAALVAIILLAKK